MLMLHMLTKAKKMELLSTKFSISLMKNTIEPKHTTKTEP